MALIKLNLIRHNPSAIALIRRVLQVPTGLRFLDKTTDHCIFVLSGSILCLSLDAPHLEVLDSIAILIFRWSLPSNHVCTKGGEAQFEDVVGREGGDDVADGGVDDRDATKSATVP